MDQHCIGSITQTQEKIDKVCKIVDQIDLSKTIAQSGFSHLLKQSSYAVKQQRL